MPSTSEKQKRFFGAVMGAKEGQKGVSSAAKKAAKKMSKGQIKDFLKLKKKKRVSESFDKTANRIISEILNYEVVEKAGDFKPTE